MCPVLCELHSSSLFRTTVHAFGLIKATICVSSQNCWTYFQSTVHLSIYYYIYICPYTTTYTCVHSYSTCWTWLLYMMSSLIRTTVKVSSLIITIIHDSLNVYYTLVHSCQNYWTLLLNPVSSVISVCKLVQ